MKSHRVIGLALGAAAVCATSCRPEFPEQATPQRTCLVLSVGGSNGVAHLGAIEAIRQAGVRVDCVVGNSMGALIGSVYAVEPQQDTTARYLELMSRYVEETKRDKRDGAAGLGILGAAVVLATGGAALPALAAGAAGATIGASNVLTVDHARMRRVLDTYYSHVRIEQLSVGYATFYMEKEANGLVLRDAVSGNLADAVGGTIANPYIFPNVSTRSPRLDPGADRVAATPIDDACRLFPDARIIAINVTKQRAFWSDQMHCPVTTIEVNLPQDVTAQDAILGGPTFYAARAAGYAATMEKFGQRAP